MPLCPGCLRKGAASYCAACRKRLFDGANVPPVLTFSRPAYNQAKLAVSSDRLSISGIQTKMSLALRGGRLEMTEMGGQYILKPIPHGEFLHLDAVPLNEHLTMLLARRVFRLPVAANALVAFADGEPAYLVRRFDVQPDGSRLLQEDFAQIAGRTGETHGKNYKYDSSYEEIADLIRQHVAAPRADLERFFRLVVFNFFVHNGDAHLKNFSLVRQEPSGAYTLAPAYDLLNTRLHVPHEARLALELFKGDFETASYRHNAFYAYDDFREFARRLGLPERRFKAILKSFLDKQEAVSTLVKRSALSEECKHLYKQHVQESIRALSYSHAETRRSTSRRRGHQ